MAKTTKGDKFYQEFESLIGEKFLQHDLESMFDYMLVDVDSNLPATAFSSIAMGLAKLKLIGEILTKSKLESVVEYYESSIKILSK